jgi:Tfp pilus assembly protein FimT
MRIPSPLRKEAGFTVVETALVVLAVGIVMAVAVPSFSTAMRRYRLNASARQMSDMMQRARMQAISESRRSSIIVDTTGLRIGLVAYNDDGSVRSEQYVPLPSGVSFARPDGNTAPTAGAPTDADVSFPAKTGVEGSFQLDFNSRGFPVVATPGAINSIYLTNNLSSRAVTLNSVGFIQTWNWEDAQWVSAKGIASPSSSNSSGGSGGTGSPGHGQGQY